MGIKVVQNLIFWFLVKTIIDTFTWYLIYKKKKGFAFMVSCIGYVDTSYGKMDYNNWYFSTFHKQLFHQKEN